jgi:hypothetical protein
VRDAEGRWVVVVKMWLAAAALAGEVAALAWLVGVRLWEWWDASGFVG